MIRAAFRQFEMRALVLNAGSSSLQLHVVVTRDPQPSADDAEEPFRAKVENLKQRPRLVLPGQTRPSAAHSHAEAAHELLQVVHEAIDLKTIEVVAHRLVHGGARFTEPTLMDDDSLRELEAVEFLAPLHNKVAREVIMAARQALPAAPHVAVFDTSFHATLPEVAKLYGLDPALARKHGIARYGFHGTAYRYMIGRYSRCAEVELSSTKVVALHLGGGCSAAAIDRGRSIETSMGMTPLEGLVMGTRSGDVDPSIVTMLARGEGLSADEVIGLLNQRSGLRALSGTTEDTRDLVAALDRDPRAKLALDVFCHRIIKYVGAYLAVLGGADAILLGGVINENTPWVREAICRAFAWCGLDLDPARNADVIDRDGRISRDDARLAAWVIPAREELQLAFEAVRSVGAGH